MKRQENVEAAVRVALKTYSLDTVRYAAYAVSDAAYVFIARAGRGAVTVKFAPKYGAPGAGRLPVTSPRSPAANLLRRFREELKDEKLRAAVFDSNRELREFMILKALSYSETSAPPAQEDSGLTVEQEKELDALIAQVESEIRKESAGTRAKDPLGITRTWEEKYGAKSGRGKN